MHTPVYYIWKNLLYLFHKTFFFGDDNIFIQMLNSVTHSIKYKRMENIKKDWTVGQHKNVQGSFFYEALQLVFSVTKILETKKNLEPIESQNLN